MNFKHKVC